MKIDKLVSVIKKGYNSPNFFRIFFYSSLSMNIVLLIFGFYQQLIFFVGIFAISIAIASREVEK